MHTEPLRQSTRRGDDRSTNGRTLGRAEYSWQHETTAQTADESGGLDVGGEERVIRVPDDGVGGVERGAVVLVERRVEDLEPLGQVRIRQEEPPKRHQVRVPFLHNLVPLLPIIPTRGNERPLERLPERPQPVRDHAAALHDRQPRLDHVAVEQAADGAELADEVPRQRRRVGVVAVHVVRERREPHTDAPGADLAGDGADDLEREAAPVLETPAVLVVAVVGAVLEELLDDVPVGAVDLHAVEPGVDRVPGRLAEVVDDRRDLVGLEPARFAELLHVAVEAQLGRDAAVGAGDRGGAAGLEGGGGDAADVPELAEEDGALGVDGVHDGPPRRDLLGRPDPRRVGVALRCVGDARGLGDHEPALGGALRVVHGGVRLRHVAVRALPSQRRKNHPVGELEIAHLVRRQKRDGGGFHLSTIDRLLLIVACLKKKKNSGSSLQCSAVQ
ncbi:unnamed protein product [Urochloa decumbens]|uniref:Uncharacterized protein n=1 Tax=Urochloa decumbens TaxID=240449 RepID=A0ABC8VVG7_9POAL